MKKKKIKVQKLIKNKKKIIVLNKEDLADENESIKWANYFIKQGDSAIICNANTGEGSKKIKDEINKVMKEEYEKALKIRKSIDNSFKNIFSTIKITSFLYKRPLQTRYF